MVKYVIDPSIDTLNYLSSTLLHLHCFNALLGDEVHRRNHGCYQDIGCAVDLIAIKIYINYPYS